MIAVIVLVAFLFQAVPVYATEQIFLEPSQPKELEIESGSDDVPEVVVPEDTEKIKVDEELSSIEITDRVKTIIPAINDTAPDPNRATARIVRTVVAVLLCPILYWYDVVTGGWK